MARKLFSYYGGSDFHNKMLKIFAGISLLQGAFFFLASHSLISSVENLAENSRVPASSNLYANLRQEETFLYLMVTFAILVSTLLFIYLGLRMTHDAVGSIYRMKKDMEEMNSTGQVKKLNLRRNDYFKDVENAFNDLVQKFNPPK